MIMNRVPVYEETYAVVRHGQTRKRVVHQFHGQSQLRSRQGPHRPTEQEIVYHVTETNGTGPREHLVHSKYSTRRYLYYTDSATSAIIQRVVERSHLVRLPDKPRHEHSFRTRPTPPPNQTTCTKVDGINTTNGSTCTSNTR
jgi:hypothetical protein